MNASIELHDSEVARLDWKGKDLVIVLNPAYVHRSFGRPGLNSGSGWHEAALVRIASAQLEGPEPSFPWQLADGTLHHTNGILVNVIPVPFPHIGPIRLQLEGFDSSVFIASGTSLSVSFAGMGRFIEPFEP